MIIAYSFLPIERLLHYAILAVWLMIGVVGLVFSSLFFSSRETSSLSVSVASPRQREMAFDLKAIGSGPLSLRKERLSPLAAHLYAEVAIYSKNSRPDVVKGQETFLVGLRSSGEKKVVHTGEPLFLQVDISEQGVFSTPKLASTRTNLWIKAIPLEPTSTLIEVEGEEIIASDKNNSFVLKEEASYSSHLEEEAYYKALKTAKWWGKDALIGHYGGEEYRKMKEKEKIEFTSPHSVCFAARNDYLIWANGRWEIANFEEISSTAPMARITSIGPNQLDIEAWDPTGFYLIKTKLSPQQTPKTATKPESLFTSLKLRTSSQVIAVVGKKRFLLKTGDWLLKTSTGWKAIKRSDEIDACLFHEISGPLFIFDALEKQGSKVLMKGHLFDEMHTQIQSISLPIQEEKESPAAAKKRKREAVK